MKQFIYSNSIYITGKKDDVSRQLFLLSMKFRTVKELIEHYTKEIT